MKKLTRYKKLNLKHCTFTKLRNGIQYFLYQELAKIFMQLSIVLTMQKFNLTLGKFSFLAVVLNSKGKLCRSPYCMQFSQNSSKTILKHEFDKAMRELNKYKKKVNYIEVNIKVNY